MAVDRPRWDLAILSNLDPKTGRRPKDVLAAVNAQAETEHILTPQVLSARLRCLEQDGYVRHADSSAAPLRRVYYLLPHGTRLINDLLAIVGPAGGPRGGAAASARGGDGPVTRPQARYRDVFAAPEFRVMWAAQVFRSPGTSSPGLR